MKAGQKIWHDGELVHVTGEGQRTADGKTERYLILNTKAGLVEKTIGTEDAVLYEAKGQPVERVGWQLESEVA